MYIKFNYNCLYRTSILRLIFIFLISKSFAQCPISTPIFPDTVCLNEVITLNSIGNTIKINSGIHEVNSYEDTINLYVASQLSSPYEIKTTQDNSKRIHSFIVDLSSKLLHLEYDSSFNLLDSTLYTAQSLSINKPEGIDVFKRKNEWYMTISENNTGIIKLFSFGTQLNLGIPELVNSFSTDINDLRQLKSININDTIFTFAVGGGSSDPTIALVKMWGGAQLSLNNHYSINTFPVPESKILTSISIANNCDKWVGFATGASSGIHILEFGTSLNNIPIINKKIFSSPLGCEILENNGNYYLYVSTTSNRSLFRFDLGKDLNTNLNLPLNLGDFSSNSKWGIGSLPFALDIFNTSSSQYIITADLKTKRITLVPFFQPSNESFFLENDRTLKFSYQNAGKKFLSTTLIDSNGYSNTYSDSIFVKNSFAPSIDFTDNGNRCLNNPVIFEGLNTGTTPIASWKYNFGDGTFGNDSSVSHTFSQADTFYVTLKATTINKCVDSIIQRIDIYENTIPDFSIPTITCTESSIEFINQSTGETGEIVNWEWRVQDTLSNNKNFQTIFDSAGTYAIQLKSQLPGCSDSISKTINVIRGPNAGFTIDGNCVGDTFLFENATTGNDLSNFTWFLANGDSITNDPQITQNFDSSDTYNIRLRVSNTDGCVTQKDTSIFIHPLPNPDFEASLACTDTETSFFNRSSIETDSITLYKWIVENETLNSANPTYSFSTNGMKVVKLITTSNFGCKDSVNQTLNVLQSPNSAFTANIRCVGEAVTFQNQSNDNTFEIEDYQWTIKNETTEIIYSNENPIHIFNAADTFQIQLKSFSSSGCENTLIDSVVIPGPPEVDFVSPVLCQNLPLSFINTSTTSTGDSIIRSQWLFESTGFFNGDTVLVNLGELEKEIVHLEVETEKGCEASIVRSIDVLNSPVADFDLISSIGTSPFLLRASTNPENPQTIVWQLNDTVISTDRELTYQLNEEGVYALTLSIKDENGCSDSTSKVIIVGDVSVDLQLQNILTELSNGAYSLQIVVFNAGQIPINSIKVTTDLGGVIQFSEVVDSTIAANETTVVTLSTKIDQDKFELLDYYCVSIEAEQSFSLLEKTTENNTFCNITTNSSIFSEPYPNPTFDNVNIEHLATSQSVTTLTLTSLIGQVALEKKIIPDLGPNFYQIDVSNYNPGIYFITLKQDNQTKTYQFVIK